MTLRRNRKKLAASLILALGASSPAQAAIFLSEDFEGFTLNTYISPTEAPGGVTKGDGTDWTDVLPAGWVMNVTAPEGDPVEFRGWRIHDVDSWIATEGDQERSTWTRGGVTQRGSVLVVDPDAFDDGTDIDGSHMTSTVTSKPVDLSTVTRDKVTLLVDSFFRNEEPMDLSIDVSVNGGATYSNLWSITSENLPDAQVYDERLSFAVDNPGTGSLVVKFTLSDAANDWWWALDNVVIADSLPEFKIVVDEADGDVALVNGSDESVDLKGYTITSASGSLLPANWASLETTGDAGAGWRENTNASTGNMTETNFGGSFVLDPNDSLYLGKIFKLGGTHDLKLDILEVGRPALPSFTEYDDFTPVIVDPGQDGDTDDDGDVDLDDLNGVRNNFGANGAADGSLDGDAYPFDGTVDLDDLNGVRNNFGAVAGANAVPEPGSLVLLGLGAAGLGLVARRRR